MSCHTAIADLRAAYDRAWDLRRQGISFAEALADPLLLRGLEAQAKSHRRLRRCTGNTTPTPDISTFALEP